MSFCVYAHFKPNSRQPFYVGEGKENRAYSHSGRTQHWYNIVNKYGYRIKILVDKLTEQQAFRKEKEFIASFGRLCSNTGPLINLTEGGEGASGHKHTLVSRKKMRVANLGRLQSVETRRKLSLALSGRKLSDITKQKISLARQAMSESTRRRMSLSHKGLNTWTAGRKHSMETKLKISNSLRLRNKR